MEIIRNTRLENIAPISGFRASNDYRRSRLPFTGPQFPWNSVARISFPASHSTMNELCGDGDSSAAAAAVFCPQEAVIDDATK
ncbi:MULTISPECIES: hypothetical protein [Rhizobium]|uniref:Uncharacterized protein n=1 Tax=Rhizobium bangladeshense TaxID=1138189 RepID=A0ABS7LMH4_9HYPH|nr:MULTISPECIES: hypothetical protein [Rhizobium]MBX4869484.1 hypothetical protein [Rhizobium bangladeshense]MBX4874880.1 hypothetical protein [Rhizobium bangladeshense]MBX4885079.1 hypothetical protein [Rhizobium bangladeshense]MBX4891892.1 hypothetical protein [Rhizobium bangladeshense]MBX4897239.1 hypothetical protein [Rhizobium bangladeshense]